MTEFAIDSTTRRLFKVLSCATRPAPPFIVGQDLSLERNLYSLHLDNIQPIDLQVRIGRHLSVVEVHGIEERSSLDGAEPEVWVLATLAPDRHSHDQTRPTWVRRAWLTAVPTAATDTSAL